jgi:hypothetical protein
MDLNLLLFQHQVALMRNDAPHAGAPLGSRFNMVAHYEKRIARLRQDMGTSHYPAWMAATASATLQ